MATQAPTPAPVPVSTVNQPAQTAETDIEGLLKDGETAAETAIIAAAPAMGTPIFKTIWEAFFNWIFSFLTTPLAVYGGRIIVDLDEYLALKSALSAQTNLDAIKKTGDPDAISKASAATDAAVAAAIQYVGATHT